MKDLSEDWWDNPTRKEISYGNLRWIWNEGLQIGRNLVVTGVVVSAMPLVVLPLIAISTLGVVVSLPFGVMYASYAVTDKVMNTLLPLPEPEPPPDLLWVNETVFSACGVGGKFDKGHEVVGSEEIGKEVGYQEDYALDEEEKGMEDDSKRGTETRFELDIEEDEHGEILEEEKGFPIRSGYQPVNLGEDTREIESDIGWKEGYEEDTSEKLAEEERKTPSSVVGKILRGIREAEAEISSMVAGTGRQIPEDLICEVVVSAEDEEVGGTAIATEEGYEEDWISEVLVSEEDEEVGGKDIAIEEGYEEDLISEILLSAKDEEVGGKDIATEHECEEDSISEVLVSAEDEEVGGEDIAIEEGCEEDEDFDEEGKEMEDDIRRLLEVKIESDEEKTEHTGIIDEQKVFHIDDAHHLGIIGEGGRDAKDEEDEHREITEEEKVIPAGGDHQLGKIDGGRDSREEEDGHRQTIEEEEVFPPTGGDHQLGDMGEERRDTRGEEDEHRESTEEEKVFFTGGDHQLGNIGEEGKDTREMQKSDLVGKGGSEEAFSVSTPEDERQVPSSVVREILEGIREAEGEISSMEAGMGREIPEDLISAIVVSVELGGEDDTNVEQMEEMATVEAEKVISKGSAEPEVKLDDVEPKELKSETLVVLETVRDGGKLENEKHKVVSSDTYRQKHENISNHDQGKPSEGTGSETLGRDTREEEDGHRGTIQEANVFPPTDGDQQLGDIGEEGRDTRGEEEDEDEHRESIVEEKLLFTGGDGDIGLERRDTTSVDQRRNISEVGRDTREGEEEEEEEQRDTIEEEKVYFTGSDHGLDNIGEYGRDTKEMQKSDLVGKGGSEEDDTDVEQVEEMAVVESENVVIRGNTVPEVKSGDVELEELERETTRMLETIRDDGKAENVKSGNVVPEELERETTRMLETIRDDGKAENVRIFGDVGQKELKRETTLETIRDDGKAVNEKHKEVVSPDTYEREHGNISNLEEGKPSWGGTGGETLGFWVESRRPMEEIPTNEKEEKLEVDTEEKLKDAKNLNASIISVKVKPGGAGEEDTGFNAVEGTGTSEPAPEIDQAITVAEEPAKLKRLVVRVKRSGDHMAADIHQESGSTPRSIIMVGSGTDEQGGAGYSPPYYGDDALQDVNADYSKLASLPGATASVTVVGSSSEEKATAVPGAEVMHDDEEKIWEHIYAMKAIIGYEEPPKASCMEELKALYEFTGVEPFESTRVGSDHNTHLVDVNEQLHFLMTIVGVE